MRSTRLPAHGKDPARCVGEDFNEQSFLTVRDHSEFDEAIDRIVQFDRDYDRYCEVMRQPWLPSSHVPDELQVSHFLEFWRRVLGAVATLRPEQDTAGNI